MTTEAVASASMGRRLASQNGAGSTSDALGADYPEQSPLTVGSGSAPMRTQADKSDADPRLKVSSGTRRRRANGFPHPIRSLGTLPSMRGMELHLAVAKTTACAMI